jgi:serine protease
MVSRLLRTAAFAVATLTLTFTAPSRTLAQQAPWTPAYPLRSTAERALRLADASERRLPYVPGEVLIKFRTGVSLAVRQRALSALRSRPSLASVRWIACVAILRDETEPDATLLAARLSSQREVEYAEPNYLYRLQVTPDDPGFAARQWNFTAIGIDRAWDINPGATDKLVVAVIDTGLTTVDQSFTFRTWDGRANRDVSIPFRTNPDITTSRVQEGRDFVFWDGPVLDMQGHGTHVASTIGEDTDNALADAGIAYKATLMPLKACFGYWDLQFTLSADGYEGFAPSDAGGCPTSAMVEAIRYAADNGATIINMSIGGPGQSTTLHDALVYATQHGAFVAIANGNEYEEGNPVDYPAGYAPSINGVMSVAAVGRSLKRAYYSNTGPHTEIAAPGGDARDGGADGMIWQTTLDPDDLDPGRVIVPRFDRYVELAEQGTSMAAPHVAGIAALIASQGVHSPAAIEKLIRATAQDIGAQGKDNEYGYGLVQPRVALRGFGIAR